MFWFLFVAPLKLRLRGGGLTKGVGNKAKKALPTPFDSPPQRDRMKRKRKRRKKMRRRIGDEERGKGKRKGEKGRG